MKNQFIAIEGTIGVGKTTLVRRLQPFFDAGILLEVFEENPFLPYFYADRERYAFQTQLFFLLSRYHQQRAAVPGALRQHNLIADYTFAKDEIFAWLNLKDDELAMYGRVHAALGEKLIKPDLIVYLVADHEILMRRIALRDRPYERNMDPAYIREVARAYDAWLSNLTDPPVLRIDTNELDFLSREGDLNYIVGLIQSALPRRSAASAAPATPTELPRTGTLARYQELHRKQDAVAPLEADLLVHMLQLTDALGGVAAELVEIWRATAPLAEQRHSRELRQAALKRHRPQLSQKLADMMSFIFHLANECNIDLEEAYLDKMGRDDESDTSDS